MEQWEVVGMCSDSVHASNLCKFHRILISISPTEAVVGRALSIEKSIHSSVRNRLSDGRVGDLMALELNYDVWGEGTDYSEHRVEWMGHPTSCLLIKLGGWTLPSRVGCPLHTHQRERQERTQPFLAHF